MSLQLRPAPTPANPNGPASTKTIEFMRARTIPAATGVSALPLPNIEGYQFLSVFVQYSQVAADEPPVDLGVLFAYDAAGELAAGRYANLEANLASPQATNFIEVSGRDCWHGSPHNVSAFVARLPITGPYAHVVVYNRAPFERTVTVLGYLVG